jgi:tetratricopeptide (TPR) repeat protein
MFGSSRKDSEAEKHVERARALSASGELGAAVRHLEEAIRLRPDGAHAHCMLGLVLDDLGRHSEARQMLRRAVELDPRNADYRLNLRVLSARGVPMWHFSMMNDDARNAAYERAINAAVAPGSVVLDIGTGSGLLAMMAARAGARRVVTCEMDPAIADNAAEIIARNGFADRITVIARKSTELELADIGEAADVLVSETIASDLLGEGLLDTYTDARRLLKPNAAIIPARARVRGTLVSAVGLEPFVQVAHVRGFDLSGFNQFRPLKLHTSEASANYELLSPSFDVFDFDLQGSRTFSAERKSLSVIPLQSGSCVGVLQWILLEMPGGAVYENSPVESRVRRAGHWQQALHLFEETVPLTQGQPVMLIAHHNRQNLLFRLES